MTSGGAAAIAAALNIGASPTFSVWRTDAPVTSIVDAIDFAKYTPAGALDDATLTTQLLAVQRQAQLLAIQTKQMNLQMLTQGRATLDCSRPNVRGALRDATIQVPSGASGAFTSPGGASGATVLAACIRNATDGEKILATASQGSDTTGTTTARVMGFEGLITSDDVQQARELP